MFLTIVWLLSQQLEVEYKDRLEQKCHREKVTFAEHRPRILPCLLLPKAKPLPHPASFPCGLQEAGLAGAPAATARQASPPAVPSAQQRCPAAVPRAWLRQAPAGGGGGGGTCTAAAAAGVSWCRRRQREPQQKSVRVADSRAAVTLPAGALSPITHCAHVPAQIFLCRFVHGAAQMYGHADGTL